MAATPHDSTGTTVTFPGFTGTVTGITLNKTDASAGVIDISHLGQTVGATILTKTAPLKGSTDGDTGFEVSVDYIGTGQLAGGASGTLVIAGGASVSAVATVQSSSLTLAVNDVIRGSVTFRVVN
jgi:hypothetical protein